MLVVFIVTGCSTSRYSMEHDASPSGVFDASAVPEATPVWEPLSPQGNRSPYTVRGKQYQVMNRIEGYTEEGIASWYGLKFHGELTSNGEIYNMYEMSAAHKSLPLPSYVRVTNLENNLSAIVRVNDRGPFHSDRIIDLSYAAAIKLGYQKQGTAKVKLDVITPIRSKKSQSKTNLTDRLALFVQIGAFGNKQSAQALRQQAEGVSGEYESFVAKAPNLTNDLYRVRVGPLPDMASAQRLVEHFEDKALGTPVVITRALSARNR